MAEDKIKNKTIGVYIDHPDGILYSEINPDVEEIQMRDYVPNIQMYSPDLFSIAPILKFKFKGKYKEDTKIFELIENEET